MESKEVKYMRRVAQGYNLTGSDKRDATFAIRIPNKTKYLIDRLDGEAKKVLNDALLVTIASVLHEADFDPIIYLKS